jgi:hypothetical protein
LPAKGFMKQEQIPLQAFLRTVNGGLYGPRGDVQKFISGHPAKASWNWS